MTDNHFKETQRFREIAFYILVGMLQLLFLWGLVSQVIFGKPWGTNPTSNIALLFINLIPASVLGLLFSLSLKTEIDAHSIRFRMFPFHLKKKIIPWEEIESVKLVKYNGIRDYLGWGLRYSPKNGWCYTISGDQGIKISLKNGKVLLIGTHNASEAKTALELNKFKYQ